MADVTVGLLLAAAAVALLIGAELLAEHAAAAGRRLGVTGLAVGVLLAGAEPEELITAVTAAARDRPGIAVGDAIGANITMLTLALGLAAVVVPLPLRCSVRVYAAGAALTGAVAVVVLWNGGVGRPEGAVLVLLYCALVAWLWRRERQPPVIGELVEMLEDDETEPGSERSAGGLALAVTGIAVMAAGGALAVEEPTASWPRSR